MQVDHGNVDPVSVAFGGAVEILPLLLGMHRVRWPEAVASCQPYQAAGSFCSPLELHWTMFGCMGIEEAIPCVSPVCDKSAWTTSLWMLHVFAMQRTAAKRSLGI
jgi:hypothetical protein